MSQPLLAELTKVDRSKSTGFDNFADNNRQQVEPHQSKLLFIQRGQLTCCKNKRVVELTISAHADGDALLQPAVLAPVAVDAEYRALLVLGAGPVLDLLLDAAPEETLRTRTLVTVAARAAATVVTCVIAVAPGGGSGRRQGFVVARQYRHHF